MTVNNEKYSFRDDYSEMAHPLALKALTDAASRQFLGYGQDCLSLRAADLIRKKIQKPKAGVHFVSGGTQANLAVISHVLRPYEAVIACESGHIFTHETGSVEATGHKVLAVKGSGGKLCPGDIAAVASAHTDEHMVKPRLVYISQSTETGSVYRAAELKGIRDACREYGLLLYIDGARLGAALNSDVCGAGYEELSSLADIFYIGGTKNGALFGEAIVICVESLNENFRFHLKQKGALLAKGAAVGAQFAALFEDGLYDRLAAHSNKMAARLANGITALGYSLVYPTETNQVFPVFPRCTADEMRRLYGFHTWDRRDGNETVRLVTSWASSEETADEFLYDLKITGQRP